MAEEKVEARITKTETAEKPRLRLRLPRHPSHLPALP